MNVLQNTTILSPSGVKDNQLSFVSKYLYWRVSRAFPIWDKFTREALWVRGYVVNGDTSWSSYTQWTNLIRCLVLNHQQQLNDLTVPCETCVRTLDEVLWTLGRAARFPFNWAFEEGQLRTWFNKPNLPHATQLILKIGAATLTQPLDPNLQPGATQVAIWSDVGGNTGNVKLALGDNAGNCISRGKKDNTLSYP